jgi:hypothetical protein
MSQANDAIEELILAGAMEVAGVSEETGELLYNFTPQLETLYPGLFSLVVNQVHGHVMSLWQKGFVDIDITEDNPMISLTEKGMNPTNLQELDEHEFLIMENIVRAFES